MEKIEKNSGEASLEMCIIIVVIRGLIEVTMVVVVGKKGCYISYVAKRLLQGLGIKVSMCKISEQKPDEMALMDVLVGINSTKCK